MDENPNIHVTFAGEGPEEEYIKQLFSKYTNRFSLMILVKRLMQKEY